MSPSRLLTALTIVSLAAAPLGAQNQPGHVLDHTFISEANGGFTGQLADQVRFGDSVCVVGDINGDGVDDLAVGAPGTSVGAANAGGIWLLCVNASGFVITQSAINNLSGNLLVQLDQGDQFGSSVAPAGDLDGDGVPDLWVGAPGDDDDQPTSAFSGVGCVYAVLLTGTGKVKGVSKLSASTTGLPLASDGGFGYSVSAFGDLNDDGDTDLIVGAPFDDAGGSSRGASWLLLMKPDGVFGAGLRYAMDEGPITPTVADGAYFGISVAGVGDLDGNGSPDFAVGAFQDTVLAGDDGSVWLYLTEPDGDLVDLLRVGADLPAFAAQGPLAADRFGRSITLLGDIDQDGDDDLAVGANTGGGNSHGAVWILAMDGSDVEAATLLDEDDGFVPLNLAPFDFFGSAVAPAGDVDGDGVVDLWVGFPGDDQAGTNAGAIALLNLRGPTFRDLGNQLTGHSAPECSAVGTLVDGGAFEVRVQNGPGFAAAVLVIGLSQLNAPFRGGVMVPDVDFLFPGQTLNVGGKLALPGVWPAGVPLGFETLIQFWMPDAGGPVGWAATNALALVAGA